MNEHRSFLVDLAETIDRHLPRRSAQQGNSAPPPDRLSRILRWFVPNGGTLLLVAVLVLTANVWAKPLAGPVAAPGPSATTVNYQGRLADSGGSPLDGTYGMTFSLYDAPSGGSLMWGPESHAAVPVNDGLFSVGLGSQTGGGIPTSTWDGDRYLEIAVGGETLSPRELIRSVPIAGMALTVPGNAIQREHLAPGAVGGWTFFDDNIDIVDLTGITNTGDPPWQTIDVSGHVPEGATAAFISVQNRADSAGVMVQVRPVGSIGGGGQFWTTTCQSGLWDTASSIVKLDSTRSFQWRVLANGHTVTAGSIQLWGYYVSPP